MLSQKIRMPLVRMLGLAAMVSVISGCPVPGTPPVAVISAPATVEVGQTFTLNGSDSSAEKGQTLKRYLWKNLDADRLVNLPRGTQIVTTESNITVQYADGDFLPVGVYHFALTVEDNGGMASDEVSVEVSVVDSSHPTAKITAPTDPIETGVSFTIDGSGSSTSAGLKITEYRWTNVDFPAAKAPFAIGQTVTTSIPTLEVSSPDSSLLATGMFHFSLVVVDSAGDLSLPATASVVVRDTRLPTAVLSAPAQVNSGTPFTISGASSVALPPATIVKYRWASLTNNFANLQKNTVVETTSPEFAVTLDMASLPPLGDSQFQLVVIDNFGNESAPSLATVKIVDATNPVAVLTAPATVDYATPFVLDASGSHDSAPGSIGSYEFKNVDCPNVATFAIGAVVQSTAPTLTVQSTAANPIPVGTCRFELVVVDNAGNRSATTVAVVHIRDNVAPTAVLTVPATVNYGQPITMSGTSSADIGGRVATYRFTNVDCANLSNFPVNNTVASVSGTFTATPVVGSGPALGLCHFTLVVSDDSGNFSSPTTQTVRVVDTQAPTAVLNGPAQVAWGSSFTLSGSQSFDTGGGSVTTYRFANVDCAGMPAFAVGSTVVSAAPTYVVPVSTQNPIPLGRCTFSLVVVDSSGNTSSPTMLQVIILDNQAPTAALGPVPATIDISASFSLNASPSFDVGGGSIASYRFTNVDCGNLPIAVGTTSVTQTPVFTTRQTVTGSPFIGQCRFSLVVVDSSGNQSQPTFIALVFVDAVAPVALLTGPSTVARSNPILLSGAGSTDTLPGRIVEYRWTIPTTGTTVVTPSPTYTLNPPTFGFPTGTYTFRLVVVDEAGNASAPSSINITVTL